MHTLAAVTDEPLASVTFLVRNPATATAAGLHSEVVKKDTAEAWTALLAAHVVICATSARTPLFSANAVSQEAIVIAVGSHEPDARELEGALLTNATVIVEDIETALREAGGISLAHMEGTLRAEDLIPMKGTVNGTTTIPGGRPVVFKSVGMSWQDLVIANAVLDAHTPAMEKNPPRPHCVDRLGIEGTPAVRSALPVRTPSHSWLTYGSADRERPPFLRLRLDADQKALSSRNPRVLRH